MGKCVSVVNSLYNPLGFVAPVIVPGKSILRELITENCCWDCTLPADKRREWENWKDSLLEIPHTYASASITMARWKEVCIFSDAPIKAVAAVAYPRMTDSEDVYHVRFIFGKANLVPRPECTMPRLELCGAVLAELI